MYLNVMSSYVWVTQGEREIKRRVKGETKRGTKHHLIFVTLALKQIKDLVRLFTMLAHSLNLPCIAVH